MTSFHLRAVELACAGAQSVESCNWDHMERRKRGERRREDGGGRGKKKETESGEEGEKE